MTSVPICPRGEVWHPSFPGPGIALEFRYEVARTVEESRNANPVFRRLVDDDETPHHHQVPEGVARRVELLPDPANQR